MFWNSSRISCAIPHTLFIVCEIFLAISREREIKFRRNSAAILITARRIQEDIFDCSSLVVRAYSAQGKRWKYGGSVPTSNKEIYDDDFELLWPATYAQIGKSFGGASVINMARQPGDLQFLCTDSGTSRLSKITHVMMVASPT